MLCRSPPRKPPCRHGRTSRTSVSITVDPAWPFFEALWDAGGHDTISVGNFIRGCTIDLTPGSYSSITILPDPAPANYSGPAATYDGSDNLGIAYGAIIEDAIGGSGDDTLTGNTSNNALEGGAGNDSLRGGAGNDSLGGGAGDDTLDGGAGLDTAVYAAGRGNFAATRTAAGNTLADSTGAEGSDALVNIERARFADENLASDDSGAGGQAFRIYQAAFDRTPDPAGLGYWIAQMDAGMTTVDVAARFIDSSEFRSLYGTHPTTGQTVTAIYNNVLHRSPETVGYDFYVNAIDTQQKSLPQVLADFSESPEYQDQVVGVIQSGVDYLPWPG